MEFGKQVKGMLNSMRFLLALCVNISVTVLIIYGVAQVCIAGYRFSYQTVGDVVMEEAPGTDQVFVVATGSDMLQVARQLEQQGLVVNCYSFYVRTKLMAPEETILRPGSYVLNTCMTYEEIIDLLTVSA